jgi:hypothetical protein
MARQLESATLDGAAEFYASEFLRPTRWTDKGLPTEKWGGYGVFDRVAIGGRDYVLQCLYNAHFKDEHDYLVAQMKEWMGAKAISAFEAAGKDVFAPRKDKVFKDLLLERLAVDPDGNHVEGAIGKVNMGQRVVGRFPVLRRSPIVRPVEPGNIGGDWHIVGYNEKVIMGRDEWPIYAGETEERVAGRIKENVGDAGPGADQLPEGTEPLAVGANVTNISAEACIAALDTMTIRLEEGTTDATIRGRTGAQPADPDAAETGTLLFTLTCAATAIAGAVDDTDGTCSATFGAIADDTSADATDTLSYCRIGATGTGVDDHIDGNATTDATGATDWNTLSIVSGSTVSMTSAVLGMSQGSTAT